MTGQRWTGGIPDALPIRARTCQCQDDDCGGTCAGSRLACYCRREPGGHDFDQDACTYGEIAPLQQKPNYGVVPVSPERGNPLTDQQIPPLTRTVRQWAERHGLDYLKIHKWVVVRELGMPGENVPEVLNLSIEMPPNWRQEPSILGPSLIETAERAAAMLGMAVHGVGDRLYCGLRVASIELIERPVGVPPEETQNGPDVPTPDPF